MCLKVFKKKAPVIIFGCMREGVTGDRGTIHYEEFTS
jgi:hypothetical protein